MNIVKVLEMAFMLTGGLFSLAVSVALFAYAYNVISEWREHWEQQRFYRAKEKAAKHIGQSLLNDSYWFSESKPAFTLMNMIGIELNHTGSINVSELRDAWRKAIETDDKPTTMSAE